MNLCCRPSLNSAAVVVFQKGGDNKEEMRWSKEHNTKVILRVSHTTLQVTLSNERQTVFQILVGGNFKANGHVLLHRVI